MKDIKILLQDAKDVLDDLNIPYGNIVRCYTNFRAETRWGRCKKVGYNNYEIEISGRLLNDKVEWEAAMNTMIHELLHAYEGRMCHTGEWKRCAELVNREYPIYNIKRCSSAEERGIDESVIRNSFKYVIICEHCGMKTNYRRCTEAVKRIKSYGQASGYRCARCRSTNLKAKEI